MLAAAPGKTGYWNAGTGGLTGKNGMNLPTNLEIGEVPFQPWSKALYEARRADQQKNDPHARCVPPGGPRQFHTPYGLLIYELPGSQARAGALRRRASHLAGDLPGWPAASDFR